MASVMIKVAREGLVSKAHRNADTGPTSSDSHIYEIQNIPAGVSDDDVIAAFKSFKRGEKYELDYSELTK